MKSKAMIVFTLAAALLSAPLLAAEGHRASELIGKQVRDKAGEPIATVEDVVVGPEWAGPYVVLTRSVSPEYENAMVAVPYAAFQTRDGNLMLPINREQFFRAPSFPEEHWPNMGDSQWQARVNGYYGVGLTVPAVAERARTEQQPLPPFDKLDTNGDGKLSPAEVASLDVLKNQFESADTNQDGSLDPSEFSSFETTEFVMPGRTGIEGEGEDETPGE